MKKRTLNEYRQTKEYKLSDQGGEYTVPYKGADPVPEEIKEITLKQQMEEIADIVVPTINDTIFNEIIEVMSNYDELNWGWFVQDDAPTELLNACFDHKQEIHCKIFQLVLQKLK